MDNSPHIDKLKFTYQICAVIFDTDETVLNINLIDGFSFAKKSLIPRKHNLNVTFETDDMGLRRDYESARINNESLDVICIEKTHIDYYSPIEAHDFFEENIDSDLISIDNQIRVIRLLQESSIKFKKISFKMCSEEFMLGASKSKITYSDIISISESMNTYLKSKLHCDNSQIEYINKNLLTITFPLSNNILNKCHGFYDLSYHQPEYIAMILIFAALELLFLDNENGKREKLAKRCSTYIYRDESDIISNYRMLKDLYQKRCDFVHEGICTHVTKEDILLLREYLRKSILKGLDSNFDKSSTIQNLMKTVEFVNYLF